MKHSTIPSAVAMIIAMLTMAPFSRNSFKKASPYAYNFAPSNNGLPHFLPGSFVTSVFSSCIASCYTRCVPAAGRRAWFLEIDPVRECLYVCLHACVCVCVCVCVCPQGY